MATKRKSVNSYADFIQYMASLDSAQSSVINVDSDTSEEDDEIEIVKEMTVIQENHKCDLCNEGGFLIDKLLRFGGLINEKYKFVCDKCDKNFEYKSQLNSHSSKCKGPNCSQDEIHKSQKKSSATVQNCDVLLLKESYPILCKICLNIFKTKSGYTKHMNTRHSNVTHTCEVCKAVFNNFNKFRKHCFDHQMQSRSHVCRACGKRFYSFSSLKKHAKTHNSS